MINKYFLIIPTLAIGFITNKFLKLGYLKGGVLTVSIITIGYIIYIGQKQRKRYGILEEKLDPEEFIIKTHQAYKYAGKDKELNSLYNFDLAIAYISLRDYKKSLEYLNKVDREKLPSTNNFPIYYYTALMITQFNLNDESSAMQSYDKALNLVEKSDKLIDQIKILKANKYIYEKNYELSKKLFESYPKEKMSNRFRLEVLYALGYIDEKEGRIEESIKKYKKVSKEANKLAIKDLAKDRLKKLI